MAENTPELTLPDLTHIGQLDQFAIIRKGFLEARIVLGCKLYFAQPNDYPPSMLTWSGRWATPRPLSLPALTVSNDRARYGGVARK